MQTTFRSATENLASVASELDLSVNYTDRALIDFLLDCPLGFMKTIANDTSVLMPFADSLSSIYTNCLSLLSRRTEYPMRDILVDAEKTYYEKNARYGNSWAENLDEFGLLPAVIRLKEKLKRVQSLLADTSLQEGTAESINDTLLDIINYCVITTMWILSKNS